MAIARLSEGETGGGLLLQRKRGELDDLAALFGRLMGTDADAGPVGRLPGIGPGVAIFKKGAQKFMYHVWMRPAMSSALKKRQVPGVMNLLR